MGSCCYIAVMIDSLSLSLSLMILVYEAPTPPGAPCQSTQFHCPSRGLLGGVTNRSECIPLRDRCDRKVDCPAGEDECRCSKSCLHKCDLCLLNFVLSFSHPSHSKTGTSPSASSSSIQGQHHHPHLCSRGSTNSSDPVAEGLSALPSRTSSSFHCLQERSWGAGHPECHRG